MKARETPLKIHYRSRITVEQNLGSAIMYMYIVQGVNNHDEVHFPEGGKLQISPKLDSIIYLKKKPRSDSDSATSIT